MHASSKSDLQFGQSAWVTHPKQTEWEVQLISGWANEFQAGFRTMKRPVGHSSVGRSCLSDALYLLGSEPISHSFGTKSNRGSDPERGESTGPCIFVNCDCRNRKDGGQLFGSQGTPKLFDAIGQGERLNFGHARRPSHWTLKAGVELFGGDFRLCCWWRRKASICPCCDALGCHGAAGRYSIFRTKDGWFWVKYPYHHLTTTHIV